MDVRRLRRLARECQVSDTSRYWVEIKLGFFVEAEDYVHAGVVAWDAIISGNVPKDVEDIETDAWQEDEEQD